MGQFPRRPNRATRTVGALQSVQLAKGICGTEFRAIQNEQVRRARKVLSASTRARARTGIWIVGTEYFAKDSFRNACESLLYHSCCLSPVEVEKTRQYSRRVVLRGYFENGESRVVCEEKLPGDVSGYLILADS